MPCGEPQDILFSQAATERLSPVSLLAAALQRMGKGTDSGRAGAIVPRVAALSHSIHDLGPAVNVVRPELGFDNIQGM